MVCLTEKVFQDNLELFYVPVTKIDMSKSSFTPAKLFSLKSYIINYLQVVYRHACSQCIGYLSCSNPVPVHFAGKAH